MLDPAYYYIVDNPQQLPLIFPSASETRAGMMSAADKIKLDSLAPGNTIPVTGKVTTRDGTPTTIFSIAASGLNGPGWYTFNYQVVASQTPDVLAGAVWAGTQGGFFTALFGVDPTGHIVAITTPPGNPTFSAGTVGTPANWRAAASVPDVTHYVLTVTGEAGLSINWQVMGSILSSS